MEYYYQDNTLSHSHEYLAPLVDAELSAIGPSSIIELGCGNGSFANHLASSYTVVGVDSSESGILQANTAFPQIRFELASVYEDLAAKYGHFDVVLSLEVVEHLFDPRTFVRRTFDLVREGGSIIISTPYHGYIKNIMLAVSGKMDDHYTALWDGGHIKFWSVRTLRVLLEEAGFADINFRFAGRIPILAKSMVAVARKPRR